MKEAKRTDLNITINGQGLSAFDWKPAAVLVIALIYLGIKIYLGEVKNLDTELDLAISFGLVVVATLTNKLGTQKVQQPVVEQQPPAQ